MPSLDLWFFSAAVDPVLRSVLADICTQYDSGAELFAYLDDGYLWIKPKYRLQTIAAITTATRSVNLALQSTKTQVWRASCQDPIPPEFQDKVKLTLSCLGGHLQIHGGTEPSPVVLGEQATMEKTTQRFQRIATTLADLKAEGLNAQAVNDLLTMYVGAASQHVLRMSFVSKQEAHNFDRQVMTFWSHLMHRDITSPLLGGLGVGSAVQRHAAAPWRAWQSIIPTDSFFRATPRLRAQLAQFQTTLSLQMNKTAFQLKPLGAALRQKNTQKKQVSTIQRNIHKQLYNNLADISVERAILLSQSTSRTGAHLMQPSSEACEAEDRCFRVSVARKLMLPHPAAPNATDVVQSCPNKSAAGLICNKPVDTQQHQCCGCRYGGGVDRMQQWRDVSQTSYNHTAAPRYSSNKKYLLLLVLSTDRLSMRAWISSSTFTAQSHFWMSPLLLLSLATQPWSRQPAQNHDSWPKELRRTNSTDTRTSTSFLTSSRPQVDLVHTPENSSATSCETLTTLHLPSGTPGQPSKVCSTVPSPNNNSQPPLRDLW